MPENGAAVLLNSTHYGLPQRIGLIGSLGPSVHVLYINIHALIVYTS